MANTQLNSYIISCILVLRHHASFEQNKTVIIWRTLCINKIEHIFALRQA